MAGQFGKCCRQIARIQTAEADEMAGAVDQQLIPHATSISIYVEWTSELLADRAARQLGPLGSIRAETCGKGLSEAEPAGICNLVR